MIEQHIRKWSLARNHCNALPRHIIAVDTETIPVKADTQGSIWSHKFRLGVAMSCRLIGTKAMSRKTHFLREPSHFMALLNDLTRDGQTTWVIAHNLLFDFITLQLPKQFEQGELQIDWPRSKRTKENGDSDEPHTHAYAVIKSPPTIIGCRVSKTQGRVVMIDTLNWFNCPLAELATEIDLPKLDMPEFAANDKLWWKYCERDCEIVLESFVKLIQWVSASEFGMFRYTAASQAWSAYRHRFMDRCIYPHDNDDIKILERQSYFGGRSECFKIGPIDEPVYKVDVSSLFPSVMQRNQFPIELDKYEKRVEYLELLPSADLSSVIAECELSTRSAIFPQRTNGPTIYPTGRIRTTLAGPELEFARRLGMLVGVRSWCSYTSASVFTRWIDELWAKRLIHEARCERLFAGLTKRLLNSLYGKFAERGQEWQVEPTEQVINPWSRWERYNFVTGEHSKFRSFGWTAEKFIGEQEKNGRMIAISSFVTSYGRLRMNQLRNIAGQRNVYYQAVDALIINWAGLNNLQAANEVWPRELGKLRVIDYGENGHVYVIGDYRIGSHIVCAGRSGRAKEIEKDTFEQRKFVGRERLFDGTAVNNIEEQVLTWRRSSSYAKGSVGQDGWVVPFDLNTSSANGGNAD